MPGFLNGCTLRCSNADKAVSLLKLRRIARIVDNIINVIDLLESERKAASRDAISDLRHRNVHRRLQVQRIRNCRSIVARLIANLHRADLGGIGSGSQENVVVLFFVASHLFFDIQTDMNIDAVGNRGHKSRFFLFTG